MKELIQVMKEGEFTDLATSGCVCAGENGGSEVRWS